MHVRPELNRNLKFWRLSRYHYATDVKKDLIYRV